MIEPDDDLNTRLHAMIEVFRQFGGQCKLIHVEDLTERWVREWEGGIGDTAVRPGFIKTAADNGPLSAIDRKLVRAAAQTHRATGLTIMCHMTHAQAVTEALGVLREEGVAPSALIWAHANAVPDPDLHLRVAGEGAWVEFDGLADNTVAEHVAHVTRMAAQGLLERVLVSHDAGWYAVGESGGGAFRGYTTFFTDFLPALRGAGVSEAQTQQLCVSNPRKAFTVSVRTLAMP